MAARCFCLALRAWETLACALTRATCCGAAAVRAGGAAAAVTGPAASSETPSADVAVSAMPPVNGTVLKEARVFEGLLVFEGLRDVLRTAPDLAGGAYRAALTAGGAPPGGV
nr:hypothetical protein GCM10010200_036950 [Actinomadura rugatobispora]